MTFFRLQPEERMNEWSRASGRKPVIPTLKRQRQKDCQSLRSTEGNVAKLSLHHHRSASESRRGFRQWGCVCKRGARDVWQLARAGALGEGHGRDLGLDSKASGEPLRSLELAPTISPQALHAFLFSSTLGMRLLRPGVVRADAQSSLRELRS